MKSPALLSIALTLVAATASNADDAAITKQIEVLGGKVTAKDGIVTELTFRDCSKLGDAEFRAIGELKHLKSLTLYGKCHGLTDATIAHLTGLAELESIGTDGAQLTDDGLKAFTMLTNLKSASFFHTSFGMKGFTGTGFGWLKACPKLEKLTVAGISMGDEGFAAISQITRLRELRTWHTYQTEAGNAHIAKLPHLTSLNIGQRLPGHGNKAQSLSDASLPTLAKITTLESLKIGEAHFTVDALLALKSLPKLSKLSLYETDLTVADVERLRSEMKNVKIEFEPLTEEQKRKFEMYLKG